jgi:type IV pilus assembly protein PilE
MIVRKQNEGFTLIELMIIVVIIGILASIALPNYNEYIQRGKAVEGPNTLSNTRIQIEQFFQDNRTYVGFPTCPPATANFTFTCNNLSATTYTLTATGINTMAGFSFVINESNVRSSTYAGTVGATCWLKSKGGNC